MVASITNTPEARVVDLDSVAAVDREISQMQPVDSEVTHIFTPGLYTRTILMRAGSAYRSKIHKTEHQYIISQGACFVSENGGPRLLYVAPFHGITKPGTWRTMFIVMDCLWTTMHPTDKKTVQEAEAELIQSQEEPK